LSFAYSFAAPVEAWKTVAELHYRGVDWAAVTDNVFAYMRRLFRAARLVDQMITGKSPEDFVKEAMTRLWDPRDTGVEWDEKRGKPTTESVAAFLRQVVLNDYIDSKKLPRFTTTRPIEEEKAAGRAAAEARSPEDQAIARVDRQRRLDELLAFIGDDSDVMAYLRLQLPADGVVGYPPRRAA
jgi:DNA-directed RNA polymerase specialized sigma24 family protein